MSVSVCLSLSFCLFNNNELIILNSFFFLVGPNERKKFLNFGKEPGHILCTEESLTHFQYIFMALAFWLTLLQM